MSSKHNILFIRIRVFKNLWKPMTLRTINIWIKIEEVTLVSDYVSAFNITFWKGSIFRWPVFNVWVCNSFAAIKTLLSLFSVTILAYWLTITHLLFNIAKNLVINVIYFRRHLTNFIWQFSGRKLDTLNLFFNVSYFGLQVIVIKV